MRGFLQSWLGIIAVCATIIAIVFGVLGSLIGLDFILAIATFCAAVTALCIYGEVVLWLTTFDWTENPLLKATFASVLLSVLSFAVFAFFEWGLFMTLGIITAIIAGVVIVIGLIKLIFGNI